MTIDPRQQESTNAIGWLLPLNLKGGEKLIVVTACDVNYLAHALALVRSVDVFSPGYSCIVHIVNPTEDALNALERLSRDLRKTTMFVSYEEVDLSRETSEARQTYYACARFLMLAEVMPYLDAPILCLDADSIILNAIDHDFSDESGADLCLIRRDRKGPIKDHLAVATGSILIKSNDNAIGFIRAVARDIREEFRSGNKGWYLDQLVFKRRMTLNTEEVQVGDIKKKYADWDYSTRSIVWSGKGERKLYDLRYVALRKALEEGYQAQWGVNALLLASNMVGSALPSGVVEKCNAVMARRRPRVELYLPRLDLPWKRPANTERPPAPVSDDALRLRLHWKEFGARLANALERQGTKVETLEVPAWEIDRDIVDKRGGNLAIIPHRCSIDFEGGRVPVLFYMQEYFRWMFVINKGGWSAASTEYPANRDKFPTVSTGGFQDYRARLLGEGLPTKFSQTGKRDLAVLIAERQIPAGQYLFFPLQIPHDQSILYFSDLSEMEVICGLLDWAAQRGVQVVMKPHPANRESMKPLEEVARRYGVYMSEANIDDLINHAVGVYTINSGVGFESLLRLKPVVTFGRAEYDCVSFRATLGTLDQAWRYCMDTKVADLEKQYRAFFDWFVDMYAVDLSRPASCAARLDSIAMEAKELLCSGGGYP